MSPCHSLKSTPASVSFCARFTNCVSPLTQGLADIARHVTECHFTQVTRVQMCFMTWGAMSASRSEQGPVK